MSRMDPTKDQDGTWKFREEARMAAMWDIWGPETSDADFTELGQAEDFPESFSFFRPESSVETTSPVEEPTPPKGHPGSSPDGDFQRKKELHHAAQLEREEFRQKLEQHGILELVTKALMRLQMEMEETGVEIDEPKNYLKGLMMSPEFNPLQYEYLVMKKEHAEALKKNRELEVSVALLKVQLAELEELARQRYRK